MARLPPPAVSGIKEFRKGGEEEPKSWRRRHAERKKGTRQEWCHQKRSQHARRSALCPGCLCGELAARKATHIYTLQLNNKIGPPNFQRWGCFLHYIRPQTAAVPSVKALAQSLLPFICSPPNLTQASQDAELVRPTFETIPTATIRPIDFCPRPYLTVCTENWACFTNGYYCKVLNFN